MLHAATYLHDIEVIKENKFSKYFLYAIGEIVLVVIEIFNVDLI